MKNNRKKYYQTTYDNDIRIKRNRNNKYYLKKKWIFPIFALFILLFLSVNGYFALKDNGNTNVESVRILRVTDGDTIVVFRDGIEQPIRMIGIDAPESVNPDESVNSIFGEAAAAYTEEHLKAGTIIYLTFDSERYDLYDRLLAYVWLNEDCEDINYLFQYQMVKDGYARAIKIEPNSKYYNILYDAMKKAMQNRIGLWEDDEFYQEHFFEP